VLIQICDFSSPCGCEIRISRRGCGESGVFVERDTVWPNRNSLTCFRSTLSSSLASKKPNVKIRAVRLFETAVNIWQNTRRHIPEDDKVLFLF